MSSSSSNNAKMIVNYTRALNLLEMGLQEATLSPIILAGIIKAFEMCYELSWKALRAILLQQGITANSPREVFVQAYGLGLIDDEAVWLGMLKDRNETVHTYNESLALALATRIKNSYVSVFFRIRSDLQRL